MEHKGSEPAPAEPDQPLEAAEDDNRSPVTANFVVFEEVLRKLL